MHESKTVPIVDLLGFANVELIRLDFKKSALGRHNKEFRNFSRYCEENEINAFGSETGSQYFQNC